MQFRLEVLWLNDPLFVSRFSFVSMMWFQAIQLITLFICASDLELAYKYKMINNYGNIVAILVFFLLINFLLNLGNRYVSLRQLSTLIVFNLMVSFDSTVEASLLGKETRSIIRNGRDDRDSRKRRDRKCQFNRVCSIDVLFLMHTQPSQFTE